MLDSVPQYGVVSRIVATCTVVRPITCMLAALSAACGGYIAVDLAHLTWGRVLLSMLCMAGLMGVANTVNDIVDLPSDRVDKPQRPISSGRIDLRTAWSVVVVLVILTMTTSIALGITETIFATALLVLAFVYSYRLKDSVLLGNLTVGAVSCGTLLFGSLASDQITLKSSVAASITLLFVVGYEIIKTLQDRDADNAVSLGTLATKYAAEASVTAYTGVSAIASATALVIGYSISSDPLLYLVFVVPCLLVPLCSCTYILRSSPNGNRSTARSLLILRLAWFPGLISLTFLK